MTKGHKGRKGHGKSSTFRTLALILVVFFLVGGIAVYINRGSVQSFLRLNNSPTITTPGSPVAFTVAPGNTNVSMVWLAPVNDGGAPVSDYIVCMGTSNGTETFLLNNGNETSCTVTSLTNGVEYFFIVAAANVAGIGINSTEGSAIPATTPSTPQNVAADGGVRSVLVSWTPPVSDGGSAVTVYNIYQGTSSGEETYLDSVATGTSNYNSTGLADNAEYYYVVQAANIMGNGTNSSEEHDTTFTVPTAPQGLTCTAGNAFLCLNWTAPASNGGSAITGYRIYRSVSAGAEHYLTTVTTISYNDTMFSNGTCRYYIVQAKTLVGNGVNSSEVHATTFNCPSEPVSFTATQGNQSMLLDWTKPVSNGGSPITNYRIYRGASSNTETFLIQLGNVTTYNNTGLNNNTACYYKVQAVNAVGKGTNATEAHATTWTTPSAPQSPSSTAQSLAVKLVWSAPASSGGGSILHYRIYMGTATGAETFLIQVGNVLTYTKTGLTAGIDYFFKIQAVNSVGKGANSTEVDATPTT
jgi:predicted phage tail protein